MKIEVPIKNNTGLRLPLLFSSNKFMSQNKIHTFDIFSKNKSWSGFDNLL